MHQEPGPAIDPPDQSAGPRRRAWLTCPECGRKSLERMPTDSCRFFHDCRHCGVLLRPKPGDCCVFCSYADQVCPPKQAACPGD